MSYIHISGQKTANFVVGVTDNNPTEVAPTPESLTICGTFPEAATTGQVLHHIPL